MPENDYELVSLAQEHDEDDLYTDEDEYKFFYDVAQTNFFASVKFPKYCTLTKAQKQEKQMEEEPI